MINRIAGLTSAARAAQRSKSATRGWPTTTQDFKQMLEPVEQIITNYPVAALAAAFAIGVSLAWLTKRK